MAIQTPQQIDAFKKAALQQGYDPAEVDAFAAMAGAAATAKQNIQEVDDKRTIELYKEKQKIDQQYAIPSSTNDLQLYEEKKKIDNQYAVPSAADLKVAQDMKTKEDAARKQNAESLGAIRRLSGGNIDAITGLNRFNPLNKIRGTGAAANVDWNYLKNLLGLAKRGELGGQGQISDFEAQMLTKAATAGLDETLEPKEFRRRLAELQKSLETGQDVMTAAPPDPNANKSPLDQTLGTIGSAAESVGNFFLPDTTKAIKLGATQGIGAINKPALEPLGPGQKAMAAGLSVLPGLQSAGKVMGENTPIGAAGREVGANIVGGEIAGQLFGKAGEIIGNTPVGKAVKNMAGGVSKKAVNFLSGISGPERTKFAQATGEELGNVMGEYLKKTNGELEPLIGTAKDRLKGGILGNEYDAAEKVIQERVKKEGERIIASPQEMTRAIYRKMQEIPDGIGADEMKAALQDFASNFEKRYPKGVNAQELLQLKRFPDKKFGAAVTNTDVGAVLSQAQKEVANVARGILHDAFPDISEALHTEQRLYHLIPIVQDQIGKNLTGKGFIPSAVKQINVLNPATYVAPLIESDPVRKTLVSGGNNLGPVKTALKIGSKLAKPALTSQMVNYVGGK